MEMVRPVPQPPRYDDPAPASELADCSRDCRSGNAYHCNRVAVSYRDGKGAQRDRRRAAYFFGQACKLDLDQACEELWTLFEKDHRIVVTPAVRAYEKRCGEWSSPVCAHVARAYEHGWGVARSRERAGQLYRRYCLDICHGPIVAEADQVACMRSEPMCWAARRLGNRG